MSDVTIKQLAKVLDMSVDKLIGQLAQAGMEFSDPDQVISSTEKVKLLGFLRRTHGKDEEAESKDSSPRQITLRRRKVSELKVGSGRGTSAKTVNVEVRARRTYVKRSSIGEDEGTEAASCRNRRSSASARKPSASKARSAARPKRARPPRRRRKPSASVRPRSSRARKPRPRVPAKRPRRKPSRPPKRLLPRRPPRPRRRKPSLRRPSPRRPRRSRAARPRTPGRCR
jgi:translation initiation factor IF-2